VAADQVVHHRRLAAKRMLLTRIKRCFTLMEMLLVIGLVTIVASVVAINIRAALIEQRFRSEVAAIVNTLRLAQQLMLIAKIDVKVKFNVLPNDAGIDYKLEFDDPLTPNWKKEIQRSHPPLKEIHRIGFNDASGTVTLNFFSGGTVMSQGYLFLSTHENVAASGAMHSFICLPGYPHHIRSSKQKDDPNCSDQEQKPYREGLTQSTVGEIVEKMQRYKNDETAS
jgi:type II secretory pathway pseudopilin PulG